MNPLIKNNKMETLTTTISITLLLGFLFTPIFLFIRIQKINKQILKFPIYMILGIIFTLGFMWTTAWWSDTSKRKLLTHYGYNKDALNEMERFANVSDQNMEQVKRLEASLLGVGWPLKAMIASAFFSPYLLIVYLIGILTRKLRSKNGVKVPGIS